jgi:hypothetical protein
VYVRSARTGTPWRSQILPWRYGCLNELLRDIADDEVAGAGITDTRLRRNHHPYDVAPRSSSPRPRSGIRCAIGMPTGLHSPVGALRDWLTIPLTSWDS